MKTDRPRNLSSKLVIALAFVAAWCSAPARAYTVQSQHPRIWLTPQVLTGLRARAAAGSPRWIALKRLCDANMSASTGAALQVQNYALAYQISQNPAYADKAISEMMRISLKGIDAITADS